MKNICSISKSKIFNFFFSKMKIFKIIFLQEKNVFFDSDFLCVLEIISRIDCAQKIHYIQRLDHYILTKCEFSFAACYSQITIFIYTFAVYMRICIYIYTLIRNAQNYCLTPFLPEGLIVWESL